MPARMKITVGERYVARMDPEDEFFGPDAYWIFQIVARIQSEFGVYFVGVMQGEPSNMSAQIFTEDGCSPDTSKYATGFRLCRKSTARPIWVFHNGDTQGDRAP